MGTESRMVGREEDLQGGEAIIRGFGITVEEKKLLSQVEMHTEVLHREVKRKSTIDLDQDERLELETMARSGLVLTISLFNEIKKERASADMGEYEDDGASITKMTAQFYSASCKRISL